MLNITKTIFIATLLLAAWILPTASVIARDIFVDNVGGDGEAQLLSLPFSKTEILDSQLLPRTAPAWVDRGGRVYIDGKQVKGGLEAIGVKND